MDLVTFELGITTGTRLGGNGRQLEAMDLVTFALGITTGTRLGGNGRQRRHREATGGNGFGNLRAKDHHWDTLGKQREATEASGGNKRQWIW